MKSNYLLAYRILVVDDLTGPSSFGQITKRTLERHEFEVEHVTSGAEAEKSMDANHFDIIILDLGLHEAKDGLDLLSSMRSRGFDQPIILATGTGAYLRLRIEQYGDSFSKGIVQFFNKLEDAPIEDVVRDISIRVDPVKRVLRLMKAAGMGGHGLQLTDGSTATVDQILASAGKLDALARALRDGLAALIVELGLAPGLMGGKPRKPKSGATKK